MKIENYNCDGMCVEQFCSRRYTQFFILELNKMKIIICFCEKHAGSYEGGSENGKYVG